MKFTDASIRALKPLDERYEKWEENGKGLGIRVSAKRKSWIYLYRFDGKARRLTFGTYPSMSLADAHMNRAKARQLLESGIDPGKISLEAKTEHKRALSVSALVDEYMERWAKPKKRSWKEDLRILNTDVIPEWGHRKAKDIVRRDVISLLDKIHARGAPIAANRTFSVVRKMFNFALSRDIIAFSPCQGVHAPAQENKRDRFLNEDEIRQFWHRMDMCNMSAGTKLALKLQLVTGQRKGEIVAMEWSEIDFTNNIWTIPAAKAKNNMHHRVPLSSLALQLIADIRKNSRTSEWLFPSPKPDQHVSDTSIDHALRKNIEQLQIFAFTPHDLRRTAATWMSSLGVPRDILSKILNHVDSSVTARYDRYAYDIEKYKAMEKWATKLKNIIEI